MQELTIVCILMSLQLVFPYCLVITQITGIAENKKNWFAISGSMHGSRKFYQRGSNFDNFFF